MIKEAKSKALPGYSAPEPLTEAAALQMNRRLIRGGDRRKGMRIVGGRRGGEEGGLGE